MGGAAHALGARASGTQAPRARQARAGCADGIRPLSDARWACGRCASRTPRATRRAARARIGVRAQGGARGEGAHVVDRPGRGVRARARGIHRAPCSSARTFLRELQRLRRARSRRPGRGTRSRARCCISPPPAFPISTRAMSCGTSAWSIRITAARWTTRSGGACSLKLQISHQSVTQCRPLRHNSFRHRITTPSSSPSSATSSTPAPPTRRLFATGDYRPLSAHGSPRRPHRRLRAPPPRRRRALRHRRHHRGAAPHPRLRAGTKSPIGDIWCDTALNLPRDFADSHWRCAISGREYHSARSREHRSCLTPSHPRSRRFSHSAPVAVLLAVRKPN